MIHLENLDPTPAEVVGALVVGGWAPDVDLAKSTAGQVIPQWIAPDAGFGRRWLRVIPVRHHGPFHSIFTGLFLALLVSGEWGWRLYRTHSLPPPTVGFVVGLAFFTGFALHLLFDPGRKQLFWPLSGRWY